MQSIPFFCRPAHAFSSLLTVLHPNDIDFFSRGHKSHLNLMKLLLLQNLGKNAVFLYRFWSITSQSKLDAPVNWVYFLQSISIIID